MKAGDLVWLAGYIALVVSTDTGNVDYVYVVTNRGHKIMINRAHLIMVNESTRDKTKNEYS